MHGKNRRLFLIGAMKAGTTALAAALAEHPQVKFSSVKEPHYFDSDLRDGVGQRFAVAREGGHTAIVRSEQAYQALFRGARPGQWLAEATTSYMFSPVALSKISSAYPAARIIAILRDPIRRAHSHYRMDLQIGRVRGEFLQVVLEDLERPQVWGKAGLYLPLGLYSAQLERALEHFPPAQIRIYSYDQLRQHPMELLSDIASFLDIGRDDFKLPERLNVTGASRWPLVNYVLFNTGLKAKVRKFMPTSVTALGKSLYYKPSPVDEISRGDIEKLQPYYRSDVARVQQLTGLDLSGWLT